MELQCGDELLDATGMVTMGKDNKVGPGRTRLYFAKAVRDRFAFLENVGFSELEAAPTIVRYRKGELEINVYHGRQSFEIGFEIVRRGARYTIADLIRGRSAGANLSTPASEFMTRNPVALASDDSCAAAAATIREYRLKSLPIVESKETRKLVGCLRVRRLMGYVFKHIGQEPPGD